MMMLTVSRSPCCTFSADTSLFAAGFAESYIRIWNLKGEKLKGLRSDFQSSAIKDSQCSLLYLAFNRNRVL